MIQVIKKDKYKWTFLWILCLTTSVIWGQNGNTTGPEITGDDDNAWYSQPWVWVAGAVLLIILLVTLLRNTKTSKSIVDKSRIDSTVADESTDTEKDTTR